MTMMMMKSILLLPFTIILMFCSATAAENNENHPKPQQQQRKLPLVGSYSPMSVTDPMAIEAASFAVETLWMANEKTNNDSSHNNYSFLSSPSSSSSIISTTTPVPKIVEASKQVVAGLNIQLTIMLVDDSSEVCLGAFDTVVYNQFGDLSVTRWGDELTCNEAHQMLSKGEDEDAV